VAPIVNGIDLGSITLNITGSVANTGIAGQGSNSGVAIPGGLLRQNSANNGRGAPYQPYTLSVMDSIGWLRGQHYFKLGGEFRAVRVKTDRLGGTTYTYSNLNDFLATASSRSSSWATSPPRARSTTARPENGRRRPSTTSAISRTSGRSAPS